VARCFRSAAENGLFLAVAVRGGWILPWRQNAINVFGLLASTTDQAAAKRPGAAMVRFIFLANGFVAAGIEG